MVPQVQPRRSGGRGQIATDREEELRREQCVARHNYEQRKPAHEDAKHFFSCMDSRAAYAGFGTPGGDAGELINVLNSIETIVGNPFTPDDVLNFFTQYLTEMGQSGKNYFSMCSDKKAVEDWFKAANIEGSGPLLQRWNPLDTQVGGGCCSCPSTQSLWGASICKTCSNRLKNTKRKGLVEGVISAFYSIYFNPFNSLRQHLLFPVMDGASSPSAVLNIQSPPHAARWRHWLRPKFIAQPLTLGEHKVRPEEWWRGCQQLDREELQNYEDSEE